MTRTILAIGESPIIRGMVAMTLGKAGHRVIEVADTSTAYEVATSERFDAVITHLDGTDGIGFVNRFKTHPASRGVPVVIMSTEASAAATRSAAKDAGVSAWITNPFRQDQLLAAVGRLVGA